MTLREKNLEFDDIFLSLWALNSELGSDQIKILPLECPYLEIIIEASLNLQLSSFKVHTFLFLKYIFLFDYILHF